MRLPVKKHCELYFQVKRLENGFGWVIYNQYSKVDRILMCESDEVYETEAEAEEGAIDSIYYLYI